MTANQRKKSGSYLALIRSDPEFRKLWYGQIVSLLGDWFGFVASATLVASLTQSGLAIGVLIAVRMLPPFLFSPLAGVVADRYNRKYILILTDILRFFIVLGFLFLREPGDVWIIYALTALQTTMTGFFFPARNAILPDIVDPSQLGSANALSATTWSVMLALGAALGGVFAGYFGVYLAFFVDSLTYLASAAILCFLNYTQATHKRKLSVRGVLADYLIGVRYLKRHRGTLLTACQKMSFALFMGGAMEVVQVSLARDFYTFGKDGSTALGVMYAVTGIGTGVGPIVLRWLTGDDLERVRKGLIGGYAFSILGLAVMAPLPAFGLYLMGGFLRGFGSGINWVFSSHLLMATVDSSKRGRVFSADFAFFTLAHAISTLTAGFLMDRFQLGAGTLILGMAVTLWLPGWIWGRWVYRKDQAQEM